jgi:hypothetical protein
VKQYYLHYIKVICDSSESEVMIHVISNQSAIPGPDIVIFVFNTTSRKALSQLSFLFSWFLDSFLKLIAATY